MSTVKEYLFVTLEWIRRYAWLLTGAALAIVALILIVPIAMRQSTAKYVYTSVDQVPQAQVALVLGASVKGGELSGILKSRTDTAIALYNTGKVGEILVTGDNGALNHDEVTPVRKYLLDAGIPAGKIFLDHAGFDTYSSMYRARSVFKVSSMTIVTQDFHLPRAVFLARTLGIDAYGVVASQDPGGLYNYLREIPASFKALMDLATVRVPEYLGEPIPITGDGSTTWY